MATGCSRHDARGRRRGAGPDRRSRTGRGAVRSLLGPFPPDISAVHKDERLEIGEARPSPATRPARPPTTPRSRGAPRWTTTRLSVTYRASTGGSPPCARNPARRTGITAGPGVADPPGMTVSPGKATCRSGAGAARHHRHSSQPAGWRRPARQPGLDVTRQRRMPLASTGAPKCSLSCQRCQPHTIATRSRGPQNGPICARPPARMARASAARNRHRSARSRERRRSATVHLL